MFCGEYKSLQIVQPGRQAYSNLSECCGNFEQYWNVYLGSVYRAYNSVYRGNHISSYLKKEETKQGRAEGLDNIQITFSHLFSDFNDTHVNNQIPTKHGIHQDNSKNNG